MRWARNSVPSGTLLESASRVSERMTDGGSFERRRCVARRWDASESKKESGARCEVWRSVSRPFARCLRLFCLILLLSFSPSSSAMAGRLPWRLT